MDTPEQIIRARLNQTVPDSINALTLEMRRRFGDAVDGVVFYGSCLRKGNPLDGIVDLYVIVSSYAAAYHTWPEQVLAAIVPPTVGYLELDSPGGTVRAKYAVISMRDFRRGTGGHWFHPYLWGRFAQPCVLACVRDRGTEDAIVACMARAAETLIRRTVALAPAPTDATGLWSAALDLSYSTELRPESDSRARELVESNADFYRRLTVSLVPRLGLGMTPAEAGQPPRYHMSASPWRIRKTRLAWAVRRVTGKLLSPVRWLKALATFEGGLDYAAWKLERHSGLPVEIPDRVRRRPWLHIWGELWRLYRRGVLR
jgi:predicted nucleotidyltransferase